ncbi:MAG: hypothetical protein EHM41_23120 [Chloroflexi bacterium]|nr:MAG: hypothetical protein EHM41_23120 [Chloroflexota bacterium]
MAEAKVKINRAPVMTLWSTIVAEQLGFERQEALTLGKVVTGLNAQAKGQRLGIFTPGEEKSEKAREKERDVEFYIELLGRAVPAINRDEGIRAISKGKPVDPKSVERYLEKKFGESLPDVRAAMEELAKVYDEKELASKAYSLYEKFRPKIPEGVRGWGAEGELDLSLIRSLAKQQEKG